MSTGYRNVFDTIPAGQTRKYAGSWRTFRVRSIDQASMGFAGETEETESGLVYAGTAIILPATEVPSNGFRIRNASATAALTFHVQTSLSVVEDWRQAEVRPSSYPSTANATVGVAAAVAVAARVGRHRVHLRSLPTNAGNITVGDANITDTRGGFLGPGDALTLEGAGEVYAKATVAAQALSILEEVE